MLCLKYFRLMIGGKTIKVKGGGNREDMETDNINSLESSLKSYLL